MPIAYCSQHARIYDCRDKLWSDLCRGAMRRAKDVYDYIGTDEGKIIESYCDLCEKEEPAGSFTISVGGIK